MVLAATGSTIQVSPIKEDSNYLGSSVAMDADGDFIVTFQGPKLRTASAIYSVKFNADGTPVPTNGALGSILGSAADIAINPSGTTVLSLSNSFLRQHSGVFTYSTHANGQLWRTYGTHEAWNSTLSSIAINDDGSYVLAWSGTPHTDKSNYDVYVQYFNTQGQPGMTASSPVLVNDPYTKGFQSAAKVATDRDGDPIVVWQGEGSEDPQGVYARFDKQSPFHLDPGKLVLVNTTTEGFQGAPAIACNKDGDVIIVWQSNIPGQGKHILGQRYNNLGERQGEEFQISATGENSSPEVVIDATGNFFVTWTTIREGEMDIRARRFETEGTPITDEFIVNSETKGRQASPDIAIDSEGDVVITWQSERQDRPGNEILAQRYEALSDVVFEQSSYEVNENEGSIRLHINRLDETQFKAEVTFNLVGGTATAATDYEYGEPIKFTFEPGESSKVIDIPILQDDIVETNETILFKLSSGVRAYTKSSQASTSITILDDDIPQAIVGTDANDSLLGTAASETLIGLQGRDTIQANAGNDEIVGVDPDRSNPGQGEIDSLRGGKGRDRFILGDRTTVYYDDGKRKNAGLKDYAIIKDFNAQHDRIVLHGDASEYTLGTSPKGASQGTGIYVQTSKVDELIAIVKGGATLDLNSDAFEFSL